MPRPEIDIPERTLDPLGSGSHEDVMAALKLYELSRRSSHEARRLGLCEEDV